MKSILILVLMVALRGQELLNGIPVSFKLEGETTYVPTSGSVAIPGYTLKVGFNRHAWLGVKFMELTSTSNYDILIFERAETASGGFYECTVTDYFVSSGRQTKILSDSSSSNDKQVSSFSASNAFELEMHRSKSTTNGEDWEGSEFTQVCFFTSDVRFDKDSWSEQYSSCYGYEINAYVSTFRGRYISAMDIEGVASSLYGGITGPHLAMELFWFRSNPTLSSTDIIIKIGDKVSDSVGYDYHQCGSNAGDYYGNSSTSLKNDLNYSGYDDGECSVTTTSAAVKIAFSRDVNTYDQFDNEITVKVNICLITNQESCQTIKLQTIYPIMSVSSAFTIWEPLLLLQGSLLIVCLFLY